MKVMVKIFRIGCLIAAILVFLTSCVSTTAVKPTEASYHKGAGALITKEGFKFSFEFYPTDRKSPTVIYITGMGGRGWGQELVSQLNNSNFNYITFDFSNPPEGSLPTLQKVKHLINQRKSHSSMFPLGGKPSTGESIVDNEISSIIEFVERAPTHDPAKGIYLIGGSYGSWLALLTVQRCPEKIMGVVFLSPALIPVFIKNQPGEDQFDREGYFNQLVKSFGNRPALAIGGKGDIIAPPISKTGSALDGAYMLKNAIGPSVEVMEVSSWEHSFKLIQNSQKVREKIVQWLSVQAQK